MKMWPVVNEYNGGSGGGGGAESCLVVTLSTILTLARLGSPLAVCPGEQLAQLWYLALSAENQHRSTKPTTPVYKNQQHRSKWITAIFQQITDKHHPFMMQFAQLTDFGEQLLAKEQKVVYKKRELLRNIIYFEHVLAKFLPKKPNPILYALYPVQWSKLYIKWATACFGNSVLNYELCACFEKEKQIEWFGIFNILDFLYK